MAAASSTMTVTAITYMGANGKQVLTGTFKRLSRHPSQPVTAQKRACVVQPRH
jgi:hypothetical protein